MSDGTSIEMPKYNCNKQVWALNIKDILSNHDHRSGETRYGIEPFDPNFKTIEVSTAYMQNHNRDICGYYVVYKDGYKSYSPAKAFEEGYTQVN